MVFSNPKKTQIVKVLDLESIKQVSYIVGMPPQHVSNYYHRLIKPRGSLCYVALFKGHAEGQVVP